MPVNGLLKLLGISEKNAVVRDPESIARISEVLDGLGERGRFIASYAYLLARVAHADSEISEAEVEAMRERVEAFGGLPDRQAELAVKIATGRLMELAERRAEAIADVAANPPRIGDIPRVGGGD